MVKRSELFALDYYKKAVFTGSDKNMRYRIERVGDDDVCKLQATVWEGPLNYEKTAEEKKTRHLEEFSEAGLEACAAWINDAHK